MTLHLNIFEFPFPKNALCQVWLKWAQWFWKRKFLNFVNVFLLFCNYLPLEKSVILHLKRLESLLLKDALCHVWLKLKLVEIGPVVLEMKMTIWKVYGQTDNRRSEKLTWAFSSGECAKIRLCIVRTVHWTCKCSKLVPISQSLVQWPSHIVYLQTQYDLNSLFLPKKWETVDISPEGRRTYLHQTLWGGQASCSIGTWTHTGCRVGHCLGNQSNHWHFSSLHKCQEREYSHQPSKQYFFKISSEFIKNSYWQPLLGYCSVKTEEDDILSNFGDYLHIPLR